MTPVVEYPGVVEEFVGFFSRDLSYHQLKRLKQYLTGLITDGKPTVSRIASRMVDHVDQSSLNRFLTLYSWDEERVNRRRLELLQFLEGMGWRRDGVVAIDDTLLSKVGRRMPGAGRLFDHSSGRFVHAQCLVTCHYVDREKDYPLGFRQYFKHGSREAAAHGFKTKIELVMQLIDECERLGVAAENYVFDVWFLSKLAGHIQSYGKGWISRLKSNRIVYDEGKRMGVKVWEETVLRDAFKEVEVLGKKYWTYTKVLRVKKLGKVRVVVCYENKDLDGDPVYLVTSRLYWEEVRIILCYSKVPHRELLQGCQAEPRLRMLSTEIPQRHQEALAARLPRVQPPQSKGLQEQTLQEARIRPDHRRGVQASHQGPNPEPHPLDLQDGQQDTSRKDAGHDTKMTLKYRKT